jgi:hypothetical protein
MVEALLEPIKASFCFLLGICYANSKPAVLPPCQCHCQCIAASAAVHTESSLSVVNCLSFLAIAALLALWWRERLANRATPANLDEELFAPAAPIAARAKGKGRGIVGAALQLQLL